MWIAILDRGTENEIFILKKKQLKEEARERGKRGETATKCGEDQDENNTKESCRSLLQLSLPVLPFCILASNRVPIN